jgi:hypothetical protein
VTHRRISEENEEVFQSRVEKSGGRILAKSKPQSGKSVLAAAHTIILDGNSFEQKFPVSSTLWTSVTMDVGVKQFLEPGDAN